jgi:hypothetical protein
VLGPPVRLPLTARSGVSGRLASYPGANTDPAAGGRPALAACPSAPPRPVASLRPPRLPLVTLPRRPAARRLAAAGESPSRSLRRPLVAPRPTAPGVPSRPGDWPLPMRSAGPESPAGRSIRPISESLARLARPPGLVPAPGPLLPRLPGSAGWSRRRLRRWSAPSPSGLRMRLSVAFRGRKFGWSGLFRAGPEAAQETRCPRLAGWRRSWVLLRPSRFDRYRWRPVSWRGVHAYWHARRALWQVSCSRYLRIPAPRQDMSPTRARIQDSHAKAYDCAHFQPQGC